MLPDVDKSLGALCVREEKLEHSAIESTEKIAKLQENLRLKNVSFRSDDSGA
jgi:hypothetical protein